MAIQECTRFGFPSAEKRFRSFVTPDSLVFFPRWGRKETWPSPPTLSVLCPSRAVLPRSCCGWGRSFRTAVTLAREFRHLRHFAAEAPYLNCCKASCRNGMLLILPARRTSMQTEAVLRFHWLVMVAMLPSSFLRLTMNFSLYVCARSCRMLNAIASPN